MKKIIAVIVAAGMAFSTFGQELAIRQAVVTTVTTTNDVPYVVQTAPSLGAEWADVSPLMSGGQSFVFETGSSGFFRTRQVAEYATVERAPGDRYRGTLVNLRSNVVTENILLGNFRIRSTAPTPGMLEKVVFEVHFDGTEYEPTQILSDFRIPSWGLSATTLIQTGKVCTVTFSAVHILVSGFVDIAIYATSPAQGDRIIAASAVAKMQVGKDTLVIDQGGAPLPVKLAVVASTPVLLVSEGPLL